MLPKNIETTVAYLPKKSNFNFIFIFKPVNSINYEHRALEFHSDTTMRLQKTELKNKLGWWRLIDRTIYILNIEIEGEKDFHSIHYNFVTARDYDFNILTNSVGVTCETFTNKI